MSRVEDAITRVRAAAQDLGAKELARRASKGPAVKVTDDTLRTMLKKPPKSVKALMALEDEAEKHLAALPHLRNFREAMAINCEEDAAAAAYSVLAAHGISVTEPGDILDAMFGIREGLPTYPFSDILK